MKTPVRAGFSLIELLCAVAILALLTAAGLVNFQEARARAGVGRVHSDMRSLAVAVESYRADNAAYPAAAIGDVVLDRPLIALTTPIAYLSGLPADPFGPAPTSFNPGLLMEGYQYKDRDTTSRGMPGETYGHIWRALPQSRYFLHSPGPNRVWDVTPYVDYDPTNGTTSAGDISRFGPQ